MAKLERNFIGGKMNIDLDDRLIQPGIYRRGQNISVSRSDGADVGALESVRGNKKIIPGLNEEGINLQLNTNVFILGSTVDRLNDKVYYYFVGEKTEGIYEIDVSLNDDGQPKDEILRILEFSISRKVFNFQVSNIITGSAVIGDLLVWTDGLNPVRKLNIERLRGSGNFYDPSADKLNGKNQYFIYDQRQDSSEEFVYASSLDFVLENEDETLIVTGVLMGNDSVRWDYDEDTRTVSLLVPPNEVGVIITVNYTTILYRKSAKSSKGQPDVKLLSDINPEYDGEGNAFVDLQGGSGDEEIAFPGDLINLGKRGPLQPPTLMKVETSEKPSPRNNLEESFVYFAYRYVYQDGEVTPLSPFSEPAFFPAPYRLDRERGSLTSFKNTWEHVDIFFDPGSDEVTEVEIWVTKGLGRPIKSLVSINKKQEGIESTRPYRQGQGKFTYSNNKTYRTLPADQANYIFSDIPIRAQALEFVGNRLVLGNYTRNYSLTKSSENGSEITPEFNLSIDEDNSTRNLTYPECPAKSVKADREYEIGVVYLDREGRQSSVIVSKGNRTRVDWSRHNQATSLQLEISSAAPYWATHYRVFYKDVVGRFENIFPKRVILNDAKDRLYVQLLRSDINKISADSRLTYKGNKTGVVTDVRREFKVDPYSANVGNDGGFRLEENNDGSLSLDSSTASLDFFVPFEVVAEHTGNAFTEAWNVTENINLTLDLTGKPLVITPDGFQDSWSDINVTGVLFGLNNVFGLPKIGSTSFFTPNERFPLWDWNQTTGELRVTAEFYEAIEGFVPGTTSVSLTTSYTNMSIENADSEYEFVALAPQEDGDLAPFEAAEMRQRMIDENNVLSDDAIQAAIIAYFESVGLTGFDNSITYADNESTIFETVDDDIGALEDSLYYEWGQTFRCLNGVHTSSLANVVLENDQMQALYELKATGESEELFNDYTLVVTQLTTPLVAGNTYDINWTDGNSLTHRRNVLYTPISEFRASLTLNEAATIDANITINITDVIPQFLEDGVTPSNKEVGDTVLGVNGTITLPLSYFNCFSYVNGIEEVKIRSTFNAEALSPGIRASVVNESYRRRDQIAHLIHSGIFNDDISLNRLSEFNRNNQIEWELEINNGSIQKLHARDTNLVVFQENKVKNVPINKNLIQTAGGQLSTTRSNNFFNTERSYDGEYGISKNPESFATYGSRMYFADKDRGSLLRLANEGIVEISQAGTESYVRDILSKSDLILCSYDDNKDQAHFSFRNRPLQPSSGPAFQNTFILSEEGFPDDRETCNIVQNPLGDRGVDSILSQRVYSSQEPRIPTDPDPVFPLYGLKNGDKLFSDESRSPGTEITGNNNFYLLFHDAISEPSNPQYMPANNYAIQISPDGYIMDIVVNCQDNRPPDLPRQVFGISKRTFSDPTDACANGHIEGKAYHDGGERRPPKVGENIYAGKYSDYPLFITDYRLVLVDHEEYVIRLENGNVKERYSCDELALNRTPILGSHPIFIEFGEEEAVRNSKLCNASWAEEVYWFDAESELPEIGDKLFENRFNNHNVYGPWSLDFEYINLVGSGQYVSHNDVTWARSADVSHPILTEGVSYVVLTEIEGSNWTSVGLDDNVQAGDRFVATMSLGADELALLGTVALAEPGFDNPNWTAVAGYIYLTFENGYFCVLGSDGTVVTYGTCSEVLCFNTPDEYIIKTPNVNATSILKDIVYQIDEVISTDWSDVGGPEVAILGDRFTATDNLRDDGLVLLGKASVWRPYDFYFPGILTTYTVNTTGAETIALEKLTPIRGAEINYVVQGSGRYPYSGSYQVNGENSLGEIFYSPVFDTSAPRETIDGRGIQTLHIEPDSALTFPAPAGNGYTVEDASIIARSDYEIPQEVQDKYNLEDEANIQVDVTSLCYRGLAFNSVGDPLDIIPADPNIIEVKFIPITGQANVFERIEMTVNATSEDGEIKLYQWESLDEDNTPLGRLEAGLSVQKGGTDEVSVTLTSSDIRAYKLRVTVTDSNLKDDFEDFIISYNEVVLNPPTATILADGVERADNKYVVVREDTITLTSTVDIFEDDDYLTEWTWDIPSNITLLDSEGNELNEEQIAAAKHQEGGTEENPAIVSTLYLRSNSAIESQDITLAVKDSGGGTGYALIGLRWSANADDARVIVAKNRTAESIDLGLETDVVCNQKASATLYFDMNKSPRQYFTDPGLDEGTEFDGQGLNWGVSETLSVESSDNGSAIKTVETINELGMMEVRVPVLCDAPYLVGLGFIEAGLENPDTYVSACSIGALTDITLQTEAYIDQLRTDFGGGGEADKASVIYTRRMNGEILPAPDGIWTDGKVLIPSVNGKLLDDEVPFGCQRSSNFFADGTTTTGTSANTSVADGEDRGVNVGKMFSATTTVSVSDSAYEFNGTPTWTASGGQEGEIDSEGTGTSATYSGTSIGVGDFTRDIIFTAPTKLKPATGPTTYTATLNGSTTVSGGPNVSFSGDGTGTSNRSKGGLTAADGDFSLTATLNPGTDREFTDTPTYTVTGSDIVGTATGSSSEYTYSDDVTTGTTGSKSRTVKWAYGPTREKVTQYTATLSVGIDTSDSKRVKIEYSGDGGSNGSFTADDGTDFELIATVVPVDSGWTLISSDSAYSWEDTLDGADITNSGETLSGVAERPAVTVIGISTGSTATAADACSGGGTIYGEVGGKLWTGKDSTTAAGNTYYRYGTLVYRWSGTASSSQADSVCPLPDRPSIGKCGYNDDDDASACAATATTYYGSGSSTSLATTSAIYKGAAADSAEADSGLYAQDGKTREWTKAGPGVTASLASSAPCPAVKVGGISASPATHNPNQNQGTIDTQITISGDTTSFTISESENTPDAWAIQTTGNPFGSNAATQFSYKISYTDLPAELQTRSGTYTFTENIEGKTTTFTITQNRSFT